MDVNVFYPIGESSSHRSFVDEGTEDSEHFYEKNSLLERRPSQAKNPKDGSQISDSMFWWAWILDPVCSCSWVSPCWLDRRAIASSVTALRLLTVSAHELHRNRFSVKPVLISAPSNSITWGRCRSIHQHSIQVNEGIPVLQPWGWWGLG